MNVLCVCALGQHRSKLAAQALSKQGFSTRFRGSELSAPNPLQEEDIAWAQAIVYARNRHKELTHQRFDIVSSEFVLDVTDNPDRIPELWRRVLTQDPHRFYQEYTRPLIEERLQKIVFELKKKEK